MKILFITANPSLDPDEQFPRHDWTDESLHDFFEHRFDGGAKRWTREGARVLRRDGCYSDAVQTWTELRNTASLLLGRDAVPGEDYAVTDVVHCKSRNAVGVSEAHDFCVGRYMNEILRATSARVLIPIGPARTSIGRLLLHKAVGSSPQRIDVAGVDRIVVGLGSPGSNERRKLPGALANGIKDLALLKGFL